MDRLVIRNGFVVSMDGEVGDLPGADVVVEDGRIAASGAGSTSRRRTRSTPRGMVVLPGFVDTHRHTWQTPVRGVLPCCTLDNYFAVMLGSVGGHYRPEDVYTGNYGGSLEALNAGVTTLLDWSHINNTPDHADEASAGSRRRDPGRLRARDADRRRVVGVQRARAPGGHPAHPRHVLLVGRPAADARARGPRARQLELRGRAARLGARARHRRRISVHVGMRLTGIHVNHVKNLHELGLMGDDTTYIHCTDSTDEELDWIA